MRRRLPEVLAGVAGGVAVGAFGLAAWVRWFERRIEQFAADPWDEWGDA